MHYIILFQREKDSKYGRNSWQEIFVEDDEKALQEAKNFKRKIAYIIRKDKLGDALVKFDWFPSETKRQTMNKSMGERHRVK